VAAWNMDDYRQFWEAKRGSAGKAYANTSLRIVDPESGDEVPVGQVGLLEVISPQVRGANAGQWVRTTDLGRLDGDGFLWIEGRADDMIIRGGFKVEPGKVEDALSAHPEVRQAAVTGVPDTRLGEVPVAAVVLSDGSTADGADLISWLRERLAPYEIPVRIAILPELPLTGPLKVNKGELRTLLSGDAAASG
jgi:long-chain acyl-CoA synthetase